MNFNYKIHFIMKRKFFFGGIFVDKSDKLDELRLEVGMIAERVSTEKDLYVGIINTIGTHLPAQFGVAIYQCNEGCFSNLVGYGQLSEKKVVKFGDGMFSICAIKGKVTIHSEAGVVKAYAPFYNGHHLLGIFFAECHDQFYDVNDDDIVFLEEITRFIEVRVKDYFNSSSIDNM